MDEPQVEPDDLVAVLLSLSNILGEGNEDICSDICREAARRIAELETQLAAFKSAMKLADEERNRVQAELLSAQQELEFKERGFARCGDECTRLEGELAGAQERIKQLEQERGE